MSSLNSVFVRGAAVAGASVVALAVSAFVAGGPALAQTASDAPNATPAVQPGPAAATVQPSPQPAAAPTGSPTDTSATVGPNGVQVVASQPVPDTPANRAAYGQPLSHAGKRSKPNGD